MSHRLAPERSVSLLLRAPFAVIVGSALLLSGCTAETSADDPNDSELSAGDPSSQASELSDPDSDGAAFSDFYKTNYATVNTARRKFFDERIACAATVTTALMLGGFEVKQVLITNEVESQLKALKWIRISNMKALQPGDVVFTTKGTSNVAGTYSHVFVFHNYINGGKGYGMVSDNYGGNHSRNIGPGPKSVSVVAYRAP